MSVSVHIVEIPPVEQWGQYELMNTKTVSAVRLLAGSPVVLYGGSWKDSPESARPDQVRGRHLAGAVSAVRSELPDR